MERWETTLRSLLGFQSRILHRFGPEADALVSEEMYQQCFKMVHACEGQPSINLFQQLNSMSQAVQELQQAGMSVHPTKYDKVVSNFVSFLKNWLRMHPYQVVFGHAQTTRKSSSSTNPPSSSTNNPSTAPSNKLSNTPPFSVPPTAAQVVKEGGQWFNGANLRHVSATEKREFNASNGYGGNRKQQQVAPTDKLRTWTQGLSRPQCAWHYQTRQRISLEDPPPPECTDARCTFLGDWLDLQGHCTQCMHTEHTADACPFRMLNEFKRKNNLFPTKPYGGQPIGHSHNAAPSTSQENSSAPAQ